MITIRKLETGIGGGCDGDPPNRRNYLGFPEFGLDECQSTFAEQQLTFKGTVSVNPRDPPCKDSNSLLTTVPLKP